MSKRSRIENLEIIRRKASMSQQVTRKDEDYVKYSGAYLPDAIKMAQIDFLLKHNLVSKKIEKLVTLYRAYLDQQRKAFFASTCSEISKLGFILGLKDASRKATK